MHLGSPILDPKPYREGAAKGVRLIAELRKMGHPISVLNMGAASASTNRKQEAPRRRPSPSHRAGGQGNRLPSRAGAGSFHRRHAGTLISRVVYTKESGGKRFLIQTPP